MVPEAGSSDDNVDVDASPDSAGSDSEIESMLLNQGFHDKLWGFPGWGSFCTLEGSVIDCMLVFLPSLRGVTQCHNYYGDAYDSIYDSIILYHVYVIEVWLSESKSCCD